MRGKQYYDLTVIFLIFNVYIFVGLIIHGGMPTLVGEIILRYGNDRDYYSYSKDHLNASFLFCFVFWPIVACSKHLNKLANALFNNKERPSVR